MMELIANYPGRQLVRKGTGVGNVYRRLPGAYVVNGKPLTLWQRKIHTGEFHNLPEHEADALEAQFFASFHHLAPFTPPDVSL